MLVRDFLRHRYRGTAFHPLTVDCPYVLWKDHLVTVFSLSDLCLFLVSLIIPNSFVISFNANSVQISPYFCKLVSVETIELGLVILFLSSLYCCWILTPLLKCRSPHTPISVRVWFFSKNLFKLIASQLFVKLAKNFLGACSLKVSTFFAYSVSLLAYIKDVITFWILSLTVADTAKSPVSLQKVLDTWNVHRMTWAFGRYSDNTLRKVKSLSTTTHSHSSANVGIEVTRHSKKSLYLVHLHSEPDTEQ